MNKRTKRYILSYVLLVAAYILQTTLIGRTAVFGVTPSLLLIMVVCFSLVNDYVPSCTFGVVTGFLLDISSGRVLGFNAILMMYLALGVVSAGQEFFRDTGRSAAFLVVICTIVYETVFSFFNFSIFGNGAFWYMLVRMILVEALYNGIVAIPVYLLFKNTLKIKTGHSLFD